MASSCDHGKLIANTDLFRWGSDSYPLCQEYKFISGRSGKLGSEYGGTTGVIGTIVSLHGTCRVTQDQVQDLMRSPDYATASQIATLAYYYELAENANDSTGNQNGTNSGAVFGETYVQLPRGLDLARGAAQARFHTGRCVDFDGATDFLDMGTGVDKNYTTRSDRASFSVWFNLDQFVSTQFFYQNRTQVGGTDRPECETQMFTTSTGIYFDGEGASILVPAAKFNVGQWHHIVGIADDSDGPVKVYLDGVLYDTTGAAQAGANGSEP